MGAAGLVDANRALVAGGSYGGYAVNAVLAEHPDAFRAGVSLFGVGYWVNALDIAAPALKAMDRIEYGDISEARWREFYKINSPIGKAETIKVPVLYSHGAMDPRIGISETETVVKALRANGIEAPFIRFADEGHGWRKLSNRIFYFQKEADFIEKQLRHLRTMAMHSGFQADSQSRRRFEGRLVACRKVATSSAGLPESPAGRALKHVFLDCGHWRLRVVYSHPSWPLGTSAFRERTVADRQQPARRTRKNPTNAHCLRARCSPVLLRKWRDHTDIPKSGLERYAMHTSPLERKMTQQTPAGQLLATGLRFGEGPRWHNGELWFSDMHAQQVMRLASDGSLHVVVSVPQDPSGLGWLPDGQLLIVSMRDRKLMRWNGSTLMEHADLSELARHPCNDMVVDSKGRAYVGNFGFDKWGGATPGNASLICVEPNGQSRLVADDLAFPNGVVITPDGKTLIVAESYGARLTAFAVQENGDLGSRRTWAELPHDGVPDGICLDSDGCIWSALPRSNECIRLREGGEITHRIGLDQGAFACMLGGPNGDTLYVLTAASSAPERCRAEATGRIEAFVAPSARAGMP